MLNTLLALLGAALIIYAISKVMSNSKTAGGAVPPVDNGNIGEGPGCVEYYNNTSEPIAEISFVSCSGQVLSNHVVDPGQSICIQEGTLGGEASAFLQRLGSC